MINKYLAECHASSNRPPLLKLMVKEQYIFHIISDISIDTSLNLDLHSKIDIWKQRKDFSNFS